MVLTLQGTNFDLIYNIIESQLFLKLVSIQQCQDFHCCPQMSSEWTHLLAKKPYLLVAVFSFFLIGVIPILFSFDSPVDEFVLIFVFPLSVPLLLCSALSISFLQYNWRCGNLFKIQ